MPNSTLLVDYLGQGAAGSRPVAPSTAVGTLTYYYANDTGVLSFYDWNAAAWVNLVSGITPGIVLLATMIASSSASLNFDSLLTSTYKSYLLVLESLTGSVGGGANLYIQLGAGGGPTYVTTGYAWGVTYVITAAPTTPAANGSSSAAGMQISDGFGLFPLSTAALINGTQSAAIPSTATGQFGAYVASDIVIANWGGGLNVAGPYNSVRLIPNNGTIVDGQASLFGIK